MAVRGKRLIFVDEMTINAQEAETTVATIQPGHAVAYAAAGAGVQLDTGADTVGEPLLIADYDFLKAGDVDDTYAQGVTLTFRQLESNKRANVRVASGNNITLRGTRLARDGTTGGNLKIAAVGDTPVATADEIINVTANDTLVRVRGL